MKNKLCLALVFLVFVSNPGYSKDNIQPEPSFYFDGFTPPKDKKCIPSGNQEGPSFLNQDTCILESYPYLKRDFKMTKKDLEKYLTSSLEYETGEFKINKKTVLGYDLITYESKFPSYILPNGKYLTIQKAIYI